MTTSIRRLVGTAALGGALALATTIPPAAAYPDAPKTTAVDGTCEGELRRLHDQARANAGLPALREDPSYDQVSRAWAFNQARTGTMAHNPQYVSQIGRAVPSWRRITENVGYAPTAERLNQAYKDSPGHRANILDSRVQRIAVGCVRDGNGRLWSTVNFVGATTTLADRRPTPFKSAGDASSRLRWWLLAKGPSATQVEADAANLLRSWSAADLAAYLATSTTHAGLVPGTVRLYGGAFDREPDAAGLVFWIQQRQRGVTLDRMATSFASSAEFVKLYGDLADRPFVEQVYRNVLDREPDASGTDYWVAQLAKGVSRGKVIVGFTESTENKQATADDVTVSWAFAQMVARMPTATERVQWTTMLALGATAEDLVRSLAGSETFRRRVAAGSY
ncbi:MAG TPA: DUF4214 domain-containing protein [Iamia sp.]